MGFNSSSWDLLFDIKTIEQARKEYKDLTDRIKAMEELAAEQRVELIPKKQCLKVGFEKTFNAADYSSRSVQVVCQKPEGHADPCFP